MIYYTTYIKKVNLFEPNTAQKLLTTGNKTTIINIDEVYAKIGNRKEV